MASESMSLGAPALADAEPGRRGRRRYAIIAGIAAVYTYLLIVFGGIVRITGSGLGCGDDWPRCNGQWIPTFDLQTFIEWFHRLLAASLLLPFGAMFLVSFIYRRSEGFRGRGGLLQFAGLTIVLLVVQALLGALTVKLELQSPIVTVMHFGLANLLLGLLVLATIRAGGFGAAADHATSGGLTDPRSRTSRFARAARFAAGLGFVLLLMGALTANVGKTPGAAGAGPAAWACGVVEGNFFLKSFLLCNGQIIPESGGGPFVHLQWTHRMLAFLLFLHVAGAVFAAWRRGAAPAVRWAATASLGLIVLQLAVALHLILFRLPESLQALHLVVGVAVWVALAAWAVLASRTSAPVPAGRAAAS